VRILGIAGSLREGSLNRALLRAAVRTAAPDVLLEPADLRGIPVYDADLQRSNEPEQVRLLKAAVRAADAVLFSTPEYNHGLPGVLKNAIDWVSRPPAESPWEGKPVAMMGASDGPWGTVRAQQQLRLAMASVGALAMVRPQLMVAQADRILDPAGEFSDEATLRRVAAHVAALAAWARRLGRH
jgi:chromate reductase